MSKGRGAHGLKAYARLLLVNASTKSKCHILSCLEDVMIQSIKNMTWLEWFRLRLPRFVPVSLPWLTSQHYCMQCHIDLMTLKVPGKS